MTDDEHDRIERACLKIVVDCSHAADSYRHDAFVNLFTKDGVLSLARGEFRGHTAIAAMLDGRDRKQLSRHVVTNARITVQDSTHATGIVYLTLYKGVPAAGDSVVYDTAPESVGYYEDRYVKTADGWRFAERRSIPLFLRRR
ncbi:MAG: nuclear transport factor 2 family protein [Alphaproteobacteria bacterium]